MAEDIKTSEPGWIIDPAILYESPGRSLRHMAFKRSQKCYCVLEFHFSPGNPGADCRLIRAWHKGTDCPRSRASRVSPWARPGLLASDYCHCGAVSAYGAEPHKTMASFTTESPPLGNSDIG